jgi:hypothetical protein
MTKERRAAIEQWEKIRARIALDGVFEKPSTEYYWSNNCWLCNYVRDNAAPYPDNGCSKCPLWKWSSAHYAGVKKTDCGCGSNSTHSDTLYHKVCDERRTSTERIKACDLIIAALKGEKIWEATYEV